MGNGIDRSQKRARCVVQDCVSYYIAMKSNVFFIITRSHKIKTLSLFINCIYKMNLLCFRCNHVNKDSIRNRR